MKEFRYFNLEEFACQETGENEINLDFVEFLDQLRHLCCFPFKIVSGYRSPNHSIEAAKQTPGSHARGFAADISIINRTDLNTGLKLSKNAARFRLLTVALDLGCKRIGFNKSTVHLDLDPSLPPEVIWDYYQS